MREDVKSLGKQKALEAGGKIKPFGPDGSEFKSHALPMLSVALSKRFL